MAILLLGDSHSDPFVRIPGVTRFDLSKCNPWLFTSHRFTNDNDKDLWDRLDPWFTNHTINSQDPSKVLVITGGEIDIRAHYWRHIPREFSTPDDLTQFVKTKATTFYNKLSEVAQKYNLDNIVVWGAPVTGEKAHYNSEHPFSGSSVTRNILVHLWNKAFAEIIVSTNKFSLATAYYNFINPADYSTVTPNPSHDGVHWHDNYGPVFWNEIIVPAIQKPGIFLGENWNSTYNDKFAMTETISQGVSQYDSWVRSEQVKDMSDIDHHVQIDENNYSWVRAAQRSKLPDQYIELSLKKL
jgi:hypothetical protein